MSFSGSDIGQCDIFDATSFDGHHFNISFVRTDVIASSDTAVVYKGRSVHDGQELAIKVFKSPVDNTYEELYRRELKAVRQVHHPRILPFLGMSEQHFHLAIISPYMKNGNLLEYVTSHKDADRKRLIIQVADAVTYLHVNQGIVHGDIKSRNVMISETGDALLADFALSTVVDRAHFSGTTRTAVRIMYSLQFAGPEILLDNAGTSSDCGPRSKTCESDVYAFGMFILEAITGRAPWATSNYVAVVAKVCLGLLPTLPAGNGVLFGLSDVWWNICLHCWRMDPAQRPSIDLVRQELWANEKPSSSVFLPNGNSVFSVSFLPTGNRIVAGFEDKTIKTWDLDDSNPQLGVLHGHTGDVNCVAASPDGRYIVSCGEDLTIRRWDSVTGAPVGQPFVGHTRPIVCVAYSPLGDLIASASKDASVRIWDATSSEGKHHTLSAHVGTVRGVAFSPDGALVASGGYDRVIRLWAVPPGALAGTLAGHDDTVSAVAFTPDGTRLVSGACDHTVRVWHVASRRLEHTLLGHCEWVRTVAVSPWGRYAASAADDNHIRVWDVVTGEPVGAPLAGHAKWIFAIAFSGDGRRLVSASRDMTVRSWRLFE